MSVLKLDALERLRCLIIEAVPALDGKICVGIGASGHKLTFPSLAVDVERFTYEPFQERVSHSPSHSCAVFNVGFFNADIELKLSAATTGERYAMEQSIVALFLATEGHPGVLFANITTSEEYGPWIASFELEDSTWEDEFAFDKKYASTIKLRASIPALVTRNKTYTIKEIALAITDDFTIPTTSADITTSTDVLDVFSITETDAERI